MKGVDIKYALAEESVCEEKSEVCCHKESVIEQKIHLNKDELNIRDYDYVNPVDYNEEFDDNLCKDHINIGFR